MFPTGFCEVLTIANRSASCCAGESLLASKPPVSAFVPPPAADGAAGLEDGDGAAVCAHEAPGTANQSIIAVTIAAQLSIVARVGLMSATF